MPAPPQPPAPSPPPPVRDTLAPVAGSIGPAGRQRIATVVRKGLSLRITAGEAAVARVSARAARIGGLGTATVSLAAGAPRTLTLELGRKAKARLRKARRTVTVIVRVVLTDSSGNSATSERKLKLRR